MCIVTLYLFYFFTYICMLHHHPVHGFITPHVVIANQDLKNYSFIIR